LREYIGVNLVLGFKREEEKERKKGKKPTDELGDV